MILKTKLKLQKNKMFHCAKRVQDRIAKMAFNAIQQLKNVKLTSAISIVYICSVYHKIPLLLFLIIINFNMVNLPGTYCTKCVVKVLNIGV